eukprot:gene100-5510_t
MSLSAAIFRRGGPKKELFNDEEAEEHIDPETKAEVELILKLKELTEVLAVPKEGRDFSAAIWRADIKAAEVVMGRRAVGHSNGFTWNKKLYLHIEEAVFYVDRGDLLLFVEVPSSYSNADTGDTKAPQRRLLALQECYEMMLGLGISMERYIVSSKLQRSGYLVMRHPSRWVLQPNESPRSIWKSAWGHGNGQECPNEAPKAALGDQRGQECPNDATMEDAGSVAMQQGRRRVHALRSKPLQDEHTKDSKLGDHSRGEQQQQPCPVVKHRAWWPAQGPHHKAMEGVPQEYFDSIPQLPVLPPSAGVLKPRFPRLMPFGKISPDTALGEPSSCSRLVFDVYKPGSKVARKQGSFPDLFCHIAISSGSPPSLQDMRHADSQAVGGTTIKWAAVEDGIVSFYSIGTVDLINLL